MRKLTFTQEQYNYWKDKEFSELQKTEKIMGNIEDDIKCNYHMSEQTLGMLKNGRFAKKGLDFFIDLKNSFKYCLDESDKAVKSYQYYVGETPQKFEEYLDNSLQVISLLNSQIGVLSLKE